MMPKTTKSVNTYSNFLKEDNELEKQKLQDKINNLSEKQKYVVHTLDRLKYKERQNSQALDRVILMNQAGAKMEEMQRNNIQCYDLV